MTVYGCVRSLQAFAYEVVWPTVLGYRALQVVVVRDPSGRMRDCYLFTTDRQASLSWVITQFAWRWSIEVLFRASKQVLALEAPQHWSRESVEKLAPWVWSMQSVVMVWYLTAGYESAEAQELRGLMGEWDSEWLCVMVQVLKRRAILNATIDPNSANEAELREMAKTLKIGQISRPKRSAICEGPGRSDRKAASRGALWQRMTSETGASGCSACS